MFLNYSGIVKTLELVIYIKNYNVQYVQVRSGLKNFTLTVDYLIQFKKKATKSIEKIIKLLLEYKKIIQQNSCLILVKPIF